MFRTLGKSKIALVLAILFGISLFFFRGGSRYSNYFNSDNFVATVSGTPISTTKFNRTLQLNINQFNQMLGRELSSEEIKTFQIHSLALGALINDAIFENEYDQKGFNLDETIIAKKTKERLPKLYDTNNKLDENYLNQFLQQEQLKIEDIVQIIDFETRDKFFSEAFFDVKYPTKFLNHIQKYDNHTRIIEYIKLPQVLFNIEKSNQLNDTNNDTILKEFYNNNLSNYMSEEKRNVEYILISKNDFINEFTPSQQEITQYYNNNLDLYFENEKRSFIQFNFKKKQDASDFKYKINKFNKASDIILFADINKIQYNKFNNLSNNEVLDEISEVLFKLEINQQSDVIESTIASHIIILQNIEPAKQLELNEVQNTINNTITDIEVSNFFNELNSDISEKIIEGYLMGDIANEFNLELKKINNLSRNFKAYDDNQSEFFNNLITNAFNANKDFINDIVSIDSNNFYIFNVLDIKSSKPIELSIIKENVLKDWELSKKIEKVNKLFKQNETNIKFVHELSNLYSQSVNKLEIKKDYTNLPKDFINNIFESNEGGNILTTNEGFFYIANIKEIKMPNIKDIKKNNISLNSSLKSSFGNELLKNAKISTNDILINAVIDRY